MKKILRRAALQEHSQNPADSMIFKFEQRFRNVAQRSKSALDPHKHDNLQDLEFSGLKPEMNYLSKSTKP